VKIRVFFDKKAEWVEKILKQFGVKPEEVIAIGDSKGDMDMFQMVGFSIAFNSSCRDLDQIAIICIQGQDLTNILFQLPL
jgi:hydroxymethylpyrimidine pyrophosphatase-like HAD family hydrolase